MYAWEQPFVEDILRVRGKELGKIFQVFMRLGVGRVISVVMIFFSLELVLLAYSLAGAGDITQEKVFTSLSVLGVLRYNMFMVSSGFALISKLQLMFERIQTVLLAGESNNTCADAYQNSEKKSYIYLD